MQPKQAPRVTANSFVGLGSKVFFGLCLLAVSLVSASAEIRSNGATPASVGGLITVAPSQLATATVAVPYSAKIGVRGGDGPYQFTFIRGVIPPGLYFNTATGTVAGTPTSVGTFSFRVGIKDLPNPDHGEVTVSVTVSAVKAPVPPVPPVSPTVSVTVSPAIASVPSKGMQQFSATVVGTSNTAVTWAADGGTISSSGLFTARSVTVPTAARVTATSVADPTKHSVSTVTLTPAVSAPNSPAVSVTVSPTSSSLLSSGTQQFAATVNNTSNTGVVWTATGGTISSGGMFTAPQVTASTTVTITATSVADSTKSARSSVTVNPTAATVAVTVSPNAAALTSGNSQQFTATVQGTGNTAVTWAASSGSVSTGGMFTAPTVTSNTNVTVTATSAADSTKHASASVVVSPGTPTLSITTPSLPGAQAGTGYSYAISATGGTTPYRWSIASGSLPQGLTFSSTGQLSGTTTQVGQFSFTAQITDAGNTTVSKVFPLSVLIPRLPTAGNYDGPAELPRVYMLTTMADTPAPGNTTLVSAGGNLQTALNNANCGDTIELAAGATFSGQFTLPAKPCTDQSWIIVRTSAPDSSLPPEGSRMTPCYSGVSSLPGRPSFNCSSPTNVLAKVVYGQVGGSGPFQLAAGANHYRLMGLEIARAAGTGLVGNLIAHASGATADHLVVDRVWMHGSAQDDTMAGLDVDSMTYAAIVDSYATDFHCTSVTGACTDAHVVIGGNSSTTGGPYRIVGNFLEASGENVMFGGGGASTTPADIEVRQNHFFKPLTWMSGQPGFVGGASGNPFMVKNHLELKNAQRVLIEGNIFENSWGGFSQVGYSVLLTPKNQSGPNGSNLCPICAVTDITIRYNTISHAGAGISLANVLSDNGGAASAGERYSIHDVTIDDISVSKYKGSGTLIEVMSGWHTNSLNNISIDHITGFPDPTNTIMLLGNATSAPPMYGFSMTNSIIGQSLYPIWSTGGTTNCAAPNVPVTSLNACFPAGYTFTHNAFIAINQGNYPSSKWPAGNFLQPTAATAGFVNFNGGNGGNYQLVSSSPYSSAATDGKDLGADINMIQSLTSNVY